ncbi:hypothetical protein [Hymenobacter mellowenesis]|uniref:hypothetical protein n=1 Tax=Hymenobacter mellowenesis TaxID=3063995 RepID=UPI00272BEABB|nr:hypothetical protein [Hymenobacter sp. M29]
MLTPFFISLLLLLNGCRYARFAFEPHAARPIAGVSRATFAGAVRPVPPPAGNQPVASLKCMEVAAYHSPGNQPEIRPTGKPLARRHESPRFRPGLHTPSDTLLRSVIGRRHSGAPEPSTGWGKVRYVLGRLLAWTVYLTLVGLGGWLIFLVAKWCFALDVLGIVFGGFIVVVLALLLLYFLVLFGFFALVSKTPM